MKRILTAIVCTLLMLTSVLGFSACGETTPADNRPVLKVGMECGYQPYNWTQFNSSNGAVAIKGHSGEYANGYDVKIAKKIAEALNMRLEIYQYKWESLVPAVEAGTLDLIIAGMSPTADRKEKVDFSSPYYNSNLVIVVKKDGAYANATSLADFSGAKIVAQSGTFHDQVVDQIAGVNHVDAKEDFPAMIIALKANTIDGYIAEKPGAIADCNANSDFKYIDLVNNETGFTITDLSNVTLAVGVKKNSTLLAQINAVIEGMTQQEFDALMNEAISQVPAGL